MPNPIPRRPLPSISDADWQATPAYLRALFQAADLCDYYRVQEEPRGSNSGPWVSMFLRWAKSAPGNPWCAAVVDWCLETRGLKLTVPYPASCASWLSWATQHGLVSKTPVRGGLFILTFGSGEHHMGFVAEDLGGGRYRTIEGNTNSDGGREGYEMARHVREIGPSVTFVDLGRIKGGGA